VQLISQGAIFRRQVLDDLRGNWEETDGRAIDVELAEVHSDEGSVDENR